MFGTICLLCDSVYILIAILLVKRSGVVQPFQGRQPQLGSADNARKRVGSTVCATVQCAQRTKEQIGLITLNEPLLPLRCSLSTQKRNSNGRNMPQKVHVQVHFIAFLIRQKSISGFCAPILSLVN